MILSGLGGVAGSYAVIMQDYAVLIFLVLGFLARLVTDPAREPQLLRKPKTRAATAPDASPDHEHNGGNQ
jgi:hypothetical protein